MGGVQVQEYSNSLLPTHQMPYSPLSTRRADGPAWPHKSVMLSLLQPIPPHCPSLRLHGSQYRCFLSFQLCFLNEASLFPHVKDLSLLNSQSFLLAFVLLLSSSILHLYYTFCTQKRHLKLVLNWFRIHLTECLWSLSFTESSYWNLKMFLSRITEFRVSDPNHLVQTPPALRLNKEGLQLTIFPMLCPLASRTRTQVCHIYALLFCSS